MVMPVGPELRILQATERTLLSALRLGIALMAFGFVTSRLAVWHSPAAPPAEPRTLSLWLELAVVVLGTSCPVLGVFRFLHRRRAILEGREVVGARGAIVLAFAIAGTGIAAIGYLLYTS